jgi:glucan 1,3-beta-glucosidase
MAAVSGTMIGWMVENVPLESLTRGDWLRSLAWALAALIAPVAGAAAAISGTEVPRFAALLGRRADRPREPLALMLGTLLLALAVLAMQAALGLDFDPRYRDFPFAPLTGGAFPLLLVSVLHRDPKRRYPAAAELAAAAVLGLSAIYIVFNETIANWQALWFCAGLIALAVTLVRVRDAPG